MRWEGREQSTNVEDRRRVSPRGVAIGGGGMLVLLILGMLLGVDPGEMGQLIDQAPNGLPGVVNEGPERELTPQEERTGQFSATVLRFTEQVWHDQFQRGGERYVPPRMVLFASSVATGCGTAPSAVGPFYCPADQTVYLDPTFFDELEQRLGGSSAEFSQAYVIAHEIGHHVQGLLGYRQLVEEKRGSVPKEEFNRWSVRLELQADYLAGVWAHYGQKRFDFIEPGDIESAISSARAIGDDRLQRRSRGFVSPESFTHGTSAQRVRWFRHGLETGDMTQLKRIFELPYEQL